jgi:hypothetical protein
MLCPVVMGLLGGGWVHPLGGCDYGTEMWAVNLGSPILSQQCDNARLQLKKSKRITVRHFYSLVPMSVVLSPKATSKESRQGAPKVFR